jgi:hypothetical protein
MFSKKSTLEPGVLEDEVTIDNGNGHSSSKEDDKFASFMFRARNLFFPKDSPEVGYQKFKKLRNIDYGRFVAAALNPTDPAANLTTVLDIEQVKQCAIIWSNDGVIRRGLNKLNFAIQPVRSKYAVALNQELTDSIVSRKLEILQKEVFGENDKNVIRLRQKITRCNNRCNLHENTGKLAKNAWIYGRNALETVRFPVSNEWPQFGEPEALVPLYSTRITRPIIKRRSKKFMGFMYDDPDTSGSDERAIRIPNIVPAFNDDDGVFENTMYSGVSMLWPILSVSQTNEVLNDEDLPAAVRQLWAPFADIYTGDNKDSTTTEIKREWEDGSILVHHKEGLKVNIHNIVADIMQLINSREGNAKYELWSIGIPMFIVFEDVANFATADKSLQAFKAMVVEFYRTWLRGILEHYWYDPILADHLNVPLDDVISQKIKIKAIFEDLTYETRKDVVESERELILMGVHDEIDAADRLGEDEIKQKLLELRAAKEEQRQADIEERIAKLEDSNNNVGNGMRMIFQPGQQSQAQEEDNNNQDE